MIKNTPLEYINDRINKHLENINEHKQRILRLQDDINHFNSFIKSNEIRLTELKIIREILEKKEENNE
ncbi:hypothetical protein [Spiroplasma endosymbiont of Villa modesta]|uniref:hypothetical protein n=1 Tax=Spiroplasma endosymbiont of Villa modesta TaxID=3066293 RepID=UPI00313E7433